MIIRKLWRTTKGQINKAVNALWAADPVSQMQLEYDQAVEQLKQGREGLAQYRALVERVSRQVENDKKKLADMEAKVQAYLKAGDRDTASSFALELKELKQELAENEQQLETHEAAYENNLKKVRHASKKVGELRDKIARYDSELKLSRAEAEMSQLAQQFDINISTDLGEAEQQVQDKISLNRAKGQVAADLSGSGLDQVEQEEQEEQIKANQALAEFEAEKGLLQEGKQSEQERSLSQKKNQN